MPNENKKMLELTEITRTPSGLRESPMAVNADFVAAVHTTELQKEDVVIIGAENVRTVSSLRFPTGQIVYVTAPVGEIVALLRRTPE